MLWAMIKLLGGSFKHEFLWVDSAKFSRRIFCDIPDTT